MPQTKHRKLRARIWLCAVFLVLTAAPYFFYRFSIDRLNTFAVTRGMTFGCVLWTTVLLGAMWLRHGWARYVLISLLCLGVVGFGLIALMLAKESVDPLPGPVRAVVCGMGLYVLALIPLGASRSLRYLLALAHGGRLRIWEVKTPPGLGARS